MNNERSSSPILESRGAIRVAMLLTASLALAFLLTGILQTARADTLTVDTLLDESDSSCSDDRSLRDAIAAASTGDTISFGITGTIVLSDALGPLPIDEDLTIVGPVEGGITLDGNRSTRVLSVASGITLHLQNIVIANGSHTQGAGIYNYGGTVQITNSTLSSNHVDDSQSYGGGVYNNGGMLIVESSTFFSNAATSIWSYGGAIYNDGGTVVITNTTFASNKASSSSEGRGGGIYNWNNGVFTITNSTFSGNIASHGAGAIQNQWGNVTLRNTIIAHSTASADCVGTITNGGNNIDSSTSCGWGSDNGSMSDTDPQLGPLTSNSSSTQLFPLLTGSHAIDGVIYNAPNGCPTTDQRSRQRPIDGNRDGTAACDIGSYEVPWSVHLPLTSRDS
jgi:hypothetical protein